MAFDAVNAGFYNALTQGLGLSRNSFSILQPNNPLLSTQELFTQYMNLIPPESLFIDREGSLSAGAQFFDNYSAMNSALVSSAENKYNTVVPEAIRDEFSAFLETRATFPSLSQMPAIFRSWAFIRHPEVANKGASALAAAALDPVLGGQLKILPYLGDDGVDPPIPAKAPDWNEDFEALKKSLSVGPSRSFSYSKSTASTDVSNTWTKGKSFGFFGLWRGSRSTSSESITFANSEITVKASFRHIIQFGPVPGQWYSSALLALAHKNKDVAPWVPGPVNWTSCFDPTKGTLARFIINLVVVDGMNISIHASAKFSDAQRHEIDRNSGGGLWPFYTSNNASGASTRHTFTNDGQMDVTINSLPGVPIVLGCNIVRIEDFI